jgi:transposase-like protein
MSEDGEKRRYNDRVMIEEAARLYIQEGLTLAEVAVRLEIPQRTVESWSTKFDWGSRRKRFLSQDQELKGLFHQMKLHLARIMTSGEPIDPQDIYARTRAIAVLSPPASVQLREIEKAEAEAKDLTPEEKIERIGAVLEAVYGIPRKQD